MNAAAAAADTCRRPLHPLAFRGFSAEPLEEERCPAATPVGSPTALTPIKTEFTLSTRPTTEAESPDRPAAPALVAAPAPASGLTGDARSALEALAGQLGAVACGSSLAASLGGSWEEVGAGCWWCGGTWVAASCLLRLINFPPQRMPSPLRSLCSPSPQAFLAGVAVGLTLPSAGRQQVARQRVLTALLCFFALLVLVGCALLLGGFAQAHLQTVFYM